MVEEERSLPQIPAYWWSKPLHKTYLIYQHWQQAQSFWRNSIDGSRELDELKDEIGEEYDIYYGDKTRTNQGQLQRAKKELNKI
eukprot:4018584-Ditylum_brightwellii.AAC.1